MADEDDNERGGDGGGGDIGPAMVRIQDQPLISHPSLPLPISLPLIPLHYSLCSSSSSFIRVLSTLYGKIL